MQQTSEQKQNNIYTNKGGTYMFKKMKHMKNEKGLTLVELLAVIVILAIVAAIAIPSIGNIIENSRDKAIASEALNIISGAKLAKIDGVCGDSSANACTNHGTKPTTNIGKYIEGANENYSTYFDGTEWTITFAGFGNLSVDTKLTGLAKTTTTYTESQIKAAVDK